MFKKTKALVIALALTMVVPATAFGALLPTDKHFGGAEVVVQPDGTEIQYFKEVNGKISTNTPKVIRTVIPGENGNTIRYDANLVTAEKDLGVDHEVFKSGAYLTVSNVLRESVMHDQRLLYAKAPVSLTFSGDYLNCRAITEFDRFEVENGRVLYNVGFDQRTMLGHSKKIMDDINAGDQQKTITKPGMYLVYLDYPLGMGVHTYIYVADENEDVSYVAPTPETAIGTSAKIKVDSKEFNGSTYSINGDNYLKVRDLAYMLNGTEKQFDVVYASQWNLDTIKTYNSPAYTSVGGELATIASGTKTANPTKRIMTIDGSEINPLIYDIDGSNYVKLKDLAKIINFDLVSDSATNTISINTTTGYSEVGRAKLPSPISVGSTERLAGNTRYQTAVAISKSGWSQSDNVVLANGNDFHDALAGTSFAYLKDAPMLITPSDALDSDIRAEIERLGAKNIYILGNNTSVSQAVENDLKQKYNVVRIGGTEVLDTAVKVGDEVRKIKQFDTVIIATQINFPDVLAAAPFSAKNTMPILFTEQFKLRADTKKALQDWGVKHVHIVGGYGIISYEVADELRSIGIETVRRISGNDRYDTAIEVVKYFTQKDAYSRISICTGENHPDALTGAVLAAKNNAPLVLVEGDKVKINVAEYLSRQSLDKAYIFGGTAVVSTKLTGN